MAGSEERGWGPGRSWKALWGQYMAFPGCSCASSMPPTLSQRPFQGGLCIHLRRWACV